VICVCDLVNILRYRVRSKVSKLGSFCLVGCVTLGKLLNLSELTSVVCVNLSPFSTHLPGDL
jgi:hypothetical protein